MIANIFSPFGSSIFGAKQNKSGPADVGLVCVNDSLDPALQRDGVPRPVTRSGSRPRGRGDVSVGGTGPGSGCPKHPSGCRRRSVGTTCQWLCLVGVRLPQHLARPQGAVPGEGCSEPVTQRQVGPTWLCRHSDLPAGETAPGPRLPPRHHGMDPSALDCQPKGPPADTAMGPSHTQVRG